MKKIVFLRWAPLLGLLVGGVLAVWIGLYVDRDNRAKLEENPADPQLLLTEPGVGYRIVEQRA